MINFDKATPELFAALAAAQSEITNPGVNADNPYFKSRYAKLDAVLETIRSVFPKHGLSIVQSSGFDGAMVNVTTVVAHKSGGLVYSTASCIPAKSDAQGVGSATTYLRRYGSAAMAGIAQEDDDGNSAQHVKPTAAQNKAAQEFADRINNAGSPDELKNVGAALAKAGLPPALVASLRSAYTAKNKELSHE